MIVIFGTIKDTIQYITNDKFSRGPPQNYDKKFANNLVIPTSFTIDMPCVVHLLPCTRTGHIDMTILYRTLPVHVQLPNRAGSTKSLLSGTNTSVRTNNIYLLYKTAK
jgi:hypothetical protein